MLVEIFFNQCGTFLCQTLKLVLVKFIYIVQLRSVGGLRGNLIKNILPKKLTKNILKINF